ncbi:MAG: hypothetical protein ACYDAQ_20025, partial [Mycobacteriales bacterium]
MSESGPSGGDPGIASLLARMEALAARAADPDSEQPAALPTGLLQQLAEGMSALRADVAELGRAAHARADLGRAESAGQVAELRAELRSELRSELGSELAELKSELVELRGLLQEGWDGAEARHAEIAARFQAAQDARETDTQQQQL